MWRRRNGSRELSFWTISVLFFRFLPFLSLPNAALILRLPRFGR